MVILSEEGPHSFQDSAVFVNPCRFPTDALCIFEIVRDSILAVGDMLALAV